MDNKEKINIASEIIKLIERIIKTHQMYQGNHPQLESFREETFNLLKKFHENFEEDLVIDIFPSAYKYQEDVIYQEENVSNSNVYYFYKLGIRAIVFTKSIDFDELNKFIDIIIQKQNDSNDIVTLLWESDLKTILHRKVETFSEEISKNPNYIHFSDWIKSESIYNQEGLEAFGFDFSKKKKKYYMADCKKEIQIRDNIKLYDDLKSKNEIEIAENDKGFLHNNMKFDKKELPQRWGNMMTKLSFMYIDRAEEYIECLYTYLDMYIDKSDYKSIYFIFYSFKTNYETQINKQKYVDLLKILYKKLIEPERLSKVAKALSDLTQDNYHDFIIFLQMLNSAILRIFVDNFINIKNSEIRNKLVEDLKSTNFNLIPYYLNLINSKNADLTLEGLKGINETSSLSNEEKINVYKNTMMYDMPEVDICLFELLSGYYENDMHMSNFILRSLKSQDTNLLSRFIVYVNSVSNENLTIKLIKFVETDYFLDWQLELQKELLAVLVKRLGVNSKEYLLSLYNSESLKNKKEFKNLQISIIYAMSFLIDKDVIDFLKSLSKKLVISKAIKQEAIKSMERMKIFIDKKQRE